jgi:hypothetical protein
MFENRVLKGIFGPKRDEVTGGWTKLHNEELRDLYSSPTIIRVEEDEMNGACSTNGEKMNACRLLVGKPERPLGRLRRRCVDNNKMDIGKIG